MNANNEEWATRFDRESAEVDYVAEERERTALDLEAHLGPRPSVASVLRALRLRRGRR